MKKPQLPIIRRKLLTWYAKHGRVLPWRGEIDPYKILVSEVMLQQTQVDRVVPFYKRFLKRFSTAKKLAAASPADVIRLWGGLGYNRRALFLQRTAQAVTARGSWPKTIEGLQKLPGVGPYTSRAVAVFSFGARVSVLDVNVRRVVQRLLFGHERLAGRADDVLQQAADALVPTKRAYDWNQAIMDFGSAVCTAKRPACATCPLAGECRARPAFAKELVFYSRPRKQVVAFKESTRFVRGRVLDMLRQTPSITAKRLVSVIRVEHPHVPAERVARALAGLLDDGLIEAVGARLSLPGRASARFGKS